VKAPEQAQAGRDIRISGSGFKVGSKVEIVLDPQRPEAAVSALAGADGTFRATVRLPSSSGQHKIQVTGTSASGRKAAVQRVVLVVASQSASTGDLARPVLLTLAVVIPLVTWLVLEYLGWRGRRSNNWR
jgi:hypothetical protein